MPPFQFGRGGPGGWWIYFEPELHFDRNVLVPDLAGWRRATMDHVPNVAFFEGETLVADLIERYQPAGVSGLDSLLWTP